METFNDSLTTSTMPSPNSTMRGSVDRLVLLGLIGCFLTLITVVNGAALAWYTSEGLLFYYSTVLPTRVGGYVFIAVGFWGLRKRYHNVLSLIATIGFITLACASAVPSQVLFDLFYSFTSSVMLTYASTRFIITGISFVGALCGAVSLFFIREKTSNSKLTLLVALCFLAWAIGPFIESFLYFFFYSRLMYLPYSYAVMLYLAMVYIPIGASAFFGMLLMWNNRFENR